MDPRSEALWRSKNSDGEMIDVYPDRFILYSPMPARRTSEMPFSDIKALALKPSPAGSWGARPPAYLAINIRDEWIALPPIPEQLASELISQGRQTGDIEVVGWPWILAGQEAVELGVIVVREYSDVRAFEAGARTMDAAGYDIISTTQQEQKPSALGWVVGGPLMAMAAKGKAHIVVTYKRRAADRSAEHAS